MTKILFFYANYQKKIREHSQLRKQKKLVTEITYLETEDRIIFYLISKQHYWQKTTYQKLIKSLQNLKKICMKRGITEFNCPHLVCNLDGLKWETVIYMVEFEITVTVILLHEFTEKQHARIREFHENIRE